MTNINLALALLLASASAAASAIVIRADVPDARYQEFGAKYRDTVVNFTWTREDGTFIPGSGAGTLIAPQWVITAGHVGAGVKPGHRDNSKFSPDEVYVAGKAYPVEQVFLHPDFNWQARPGRDVALVKLAKPVEGGKPACLYPRQDEVGRIATLAGYGKTGTHLTGATQQGGILRAATATIEPGDAPAWMPDREEIAAEILSMPLREPGDPKTTPLEGSGAPGDSGGPAFLEHEGRLCIAGVVTNGTPPRHHAQRVAAMTGTAVPNDPGGYAVRGLYARVSTLRDWAADVMNGNVAP